MPTCGSPDLAAEGRRPEASVSEGVGECQEGASG